MPLTARLIARLAWTQVGSNDFGGPEFKADMEHDAYYTNGTTAGKADILFADTRTVASGSNDDLDLAGVLANAFGATITAAEVVAIFIKAKATNTTSLTVGGGTNPLAGWLGGTTPTVGPIRPGGVFLRAETDAAGICSVTASTGDILRITNGSGAAATYDIAILARTA